MQYTLIEELHTPTKVYKKLYLFDFCFVVLYCFIFIIFGQEHVHQALQIPFYIFNFIVALILTTHSPFNPQKRIFQSLLYVIRKDRAVYQPIQTNATENDLMTTDYFERKWNLIVRKTNAFYTRRNKIICIDISFCWL